MRRLLACSLLLSACIADPSGTANPDDDDDTQPDPDPDPDPEPDPDRPDLIDEVLDLPETPYDYTDDLPAHFDNGFVDQLDNTPASNAITHDGATLGRVLFHDTTLSANGTIACASCHLQAAGFADPDALSTGFDGGLTGRNAMGVMDARFYGPGRFFWDERAATLEEQVLLPIQNEVEMGLTLDELVSRVEAQPYYAYLFERAFGDPTITSDRIARALAQFSRAIVSYRSRYDEGLASAGDVAIDFPNFSTEENLGKDLFLGRGGCAACHLASPPGPGPRQNQAIFFINVATNNGLELETVDDGKGAISGIQADVGKFKSPSLRNIQLSAPYMHDGRFTTLAQVITHYDTGVQAHPNLDPRLRGPGGAPRRLNLTAAERAALVAFLETLTDDALVEDVRFTDPFRDH